MRTAGFFRLRTHDGAAASNCLEDHSRLGPCRPSGPATLVLIDPHRRQLRTRPNRRWSRCLARLLATRLDRQLAAGSPPETGRLLAARAQVLVSPGVRRELARDLANLIVQAYRPAVMRDPRGPLNRGWVIACDDEIRQTITALLTLGPVPARGAALISRLLSDGTGPLYNRHRSAQLSTALAEARASLDPLVSRLFPA